MLSSYHPSRRDMLHMTGVAAIGAVTLSPEHHIAAPPMNMHVTRVNPQDIGLDPKQLQVAYDLLEKWTTGRDPVVPGGAIIVGRRGKVIAPKFFGKQGPEPDAVPIRDDGLFLMASVTKPIVYMAGMMLVERGQLNLNDPVVRYVPAFRAHGKDRVLVSHLFTHASGLPDMLSNNAEMRKKHASLQTFLDAAAAETVPLFPPGTQLSYQSMGTAVVADIVQRLSKVSIAEFLHREIFAPLGLKSTGLGSKGFDRERLVRVQVPEYQAGTDFGWNSQYWQELGAPWGGLFSTPEDFAVLCQVMLSGGAWNGVRLLSPASVRMMTTNRLDDYADLPESVRRTQPWGLGWRLNHVGTPESWGDLLDRQVFGHTGATGTTVWMDPKTDGFCILLTTAIRENAPWRLVHLSNAVAAAFV